MLSAKGPSYFPACELYFVNFITTVSCEVKSKYMPNRAYRLSRAIGRTFYRVPKPRQLPRQGKSEMKSSRSTSKMSMAIARVPSCWRWLVGRFVNGYILEGLELGKGLPCRSGVQGTKVLDRGDE